VFNPTLQGLLHFKEVIGLRGGGKETRRLGPGSVQEEDGLPLVAQMYINIFGIGFHLLQTQQGADVIRDGTAEFMIFLGKNLGFAISLAGSKNGIRGVLILALPGDDLP
jgi:hypothetical protein